MFGVMRVICEYTEDEISYAQAFQQLRKLGVTAKGIREILG
jgi:hypothetical protein